MQEYKVRVYYNRTEWLDPKTDKLHRLDGPAVEYADGDKEWFVDGKRHRLDGPAVECANGAKEWYVEGERYSEAEFNALSTSCDGKIVEIDGKTYKLTIIV